MDKNLDNSTRDPQRTISVITGLLLGLLTLCGFTLNYDALQDLAVIYGIPDHLSFLWPLLIDGGIVTISLSCLRNQFRNESILYPASIVVLLTSLTVFFAIMHSKNQDDHPSCLGAIIAATSPLVLFLSFETMLRQIRTSSQTEISKPPRQSPRPATRKRGVKKKTDRKALILELVTKDQTHAEIASQLRCSTKTVQRTIRELEAKSLLTNSNNNSNQK